MKKCTVFTLTLMSLFLISLTSVAQWVDDPAHPLTICELEGAQVQPIILPDNGHGSYIFWIDGRDGHAAAYGQHLDKNGHALWADGGVAIVDYEAADVSAVHAVLNEEGNIIIGWQHNLPGSSCDTLYVQKLDPDGEALWDSAVAVAGNNLSDAGGFWGPTNFTIMKTTGGCFLAVQTTGYGYDFLLINKIMNDGSLPWEYNGKIFPGTISAGNLKLIDDGEGGAFLSWDNYSSYLQRFSDDGTLLWPVALKVNDCTSGAGGTYAGFPYFLIAPNAGGGIMTAWSSYSDDIYAASVTMDGEFAWAEPCSAIYTDAYSQEEIAFAKSGDAYYVSWIDSRPDAPGIYMQKFNEDGEAQWASELYVDDKSLYVPVLKSVATSEGDIALFYQAGGAFYCQKVHPDGTTEWEETLEVLNSTHQPYYQDYNLIATDNGDVIGVAEAAGDGGYNGIYAFSLDYVSGDTIHEDTSSTNGVYDMQFEVNIYPDPATDLIIMELPFTDLMLTAELMNSAGQIVFKQDINAVGNTCRLDVSEFKSGIYFLRLSTEGSSAIKKIMIN